MSNPNSNLPAKGKITLPARVNIADTLRAILYAPGVVIMSVANDGVRGASNLTAEAAIAARHAAQGGDDGTALSFLLSGSERKLKDRVGDFSFRRTADDATVATALASYST